MSYPVDSYDICDSCDTYVSTKHSNIHWSIAYRILNSDDGIHHSSLINNYDYTSPFYCMKDPLF